MPPKQKLTPPIEPFAVRIPEAVRISGFSRTWLYEQGRNHGIVFLKNGRCTLIETASLRRAIEALPRADR